MNHPIQSFYNRFSWLYPIVDLFLRPQKRVLVKEINHMPEGRLLEIGVGNGSHLHLYKKHQITGIDISAGMLKVANKRKASQVELLQMNGESLQFQDEQFEYVVLSHVIVVVENPEQLLTEVFRVLKPNGVIFILNHFTPTNWLKYIDHAFGIISKVFHFKSVFHIDKLTAIQRFTLLKEIHFGSISYFKLLMYQKH